MIRGRDVWRRKWLWLALPVGLAVVGIGVLLIVNVWMKGRMQECILSREQAIGIQADCILVLGAGVREDGRPSTLLADRLDEGIALYRLGASERILVSGDHGQEDYDEVNAMKDYLVERGVPSEVVFMDHAGFSTYESMYRARDVFQAKRVLIVTQKYHLYRALYDAERLGLEAWGAASDPREYQGAVFQELREFLARGKDFIWTVFQPRPTCLGEPIPVCGNGNVTNDFQEPSSS